MNPDGKISSRNLLLLISHLIFEEGKRLETRQELSKWETMYYHPFLKAGGIMPAPRWSLGASCLHLPMQPKQARKDMRDADLVFQGIQSTSLVGLHKIKCFLSSNTKQCLTLWNGLSPLASKPEQTEVTLTARKFSHLCGVFCREFVLPILS